MELKIVLSEKLEIGVYKAAEKDGGRILFYAKTRRECIVLSRELARQKKMKLLKIIDNNGKEIYKSKFFWRENLKF
jgi:hypothetical protein